MSCQSDGRVAVVHVLILLSMGTSTDNVTAITATISSSPASASQPAVLDRRRNNRKTATRPATPAEILRPAMPTARVSILGLPSARKAVAASRGDGPPRHSQGPHPTPPA